MRDVDQAHLLLDVVNEDFDDDFIALEPRVTYHLAKRIRPCCKQGGHFLDVGGNFGWFALLAAALGCQVDAFEPVPWFVALLQYSTALNGLQQRIRLHTGRIVGAGTGERRSLVVPLKGVLGEGGVDGTNSDGTQRCGQNAVCLDMDEVAIDDLDLLPIKRSCGMKVDVEGFEPQVFAGAKRFINEKHPEVVVSELSPLRSKTLDPQGQGMLSMLRFLGSQYEAHLLHWNHIKNPKWKVVGKDLNKSTFRGSVGKLLMKCKPSCMLFYDKKMLGVGHGFSPWRWRIHEDPATPLC